ncbi:hypothetical protein BE08_42205 [Sorangium cellulosum]|uniref:ATP-dependent DNA ligase family profile domain-containing protein n=1 Tax=Sorangium cellulosum TaxID=56 RepID=A0A150P795_SORCE|nr:hypothetical protein BE08_42205 [Sorangium cellulosum]
MPQKVRPQVPKRLPAGKAKGKASGAPDGEGWLHEIQIDGRRIMARVEDGRVRLVDEKGKDVEGRFEHIAAAIAGLGLESALLDGEVALLRRDGTTAPPPSSARAAPRQGEVVYLVFDLLYLEGRDLMESPLAARKQALRRLLGAPGAGPLRYADHVEGAWEEVVEKGCRLALKGIVSKRIDAPYVPGRGPGWVVASCGGARHGKVRQKITPAMQRALGHRG